MPLAIARLTKLATSNGLWRADPRSAIGTVVFVDLQAQGITRHLDGTQMEVIMVYDGYGCGPVPKEVLAITSMAGDPEANVWGMGFPMDPMKND